MERAALPPVAPPDWSALTAVEFEVHRAPYTELAAGAITAKEAGDLCALVATGAPFPYPMRREPCFGHPPRLRVLIGGTVRRQRWHGWPGYRPLGWERYLHVGADGALLRLDGTAVFAADPGGTP